MTTEREKIDVLRVMDRAFAVVRDTLEPPADVEMEAARVAVAELIEAIQRDAEDLACAADLGISEWESCVPKKTAAALARIGSQS